jgi:hypothetical protein
MKGKNPKIKTFWQRVGLSFILLTFMGIFITPIYSFSETIEQKSMGAQYPVTPDAVPAALKDRIFLVMKTDKAQAYIDEIVQVTIQLCSRGVTLRDIQYPQLFHEDFSIQEFDHPVEKKETMNGVFFEIIEFKTKIFGKKSGNFKLGPSRVQCTLMMSKQEGGNQPSGDGTTVDTYFGTSENYPLKIASASIPLKVVPLPGKRKPADFSGAVGNFNFTLEVHPKEVKLGEPMTLKMTIEGRGNFNTVVPPRIEKRSSFKIYDPQKKKEEGLIIYEQVLIPQSEAMREIPKIHFSFFDPEQGRYHTIQRGPLPIKVIKPDPEEGQTMSRVPEPIGRNLITVKGSPGRLRKKGDLLYKNKTFWMLQLLPLFLFLSLMFINKKKEKLRTDLRYARRQEAKKRAKKGVQEAERFLKKGKPIEFYDSLFKTLQEYLGNRFYLPVESMTGEVVDERLRPQGIDEEVLKKLGDLFNECDRVRYAASITGKKEMEEALTRIKEVIPYRESQP